MVTTETASLTRPQRWDQPFGPDMTDADVAMLRQRPDLAAIDASKFPPNSPLDGILKNDTRLVRYRPGDIVVREGDYGNSAFLILEGTARVVLAPGLSHSQLGRLQTARKGFLGALAQLWTNRKIPEVRDTSRYGAVAVRGGRRDESRAHAFLQDVPAIIGKNKTAQLGSGVLFGELAALGRVPRTATVFAETDAVLLEIRWQGLRELRRYDENWRRRIDESYRKNALKTHIQEVPYFAGLDPATLQSIADLTLFETYGSFDWHTDYQRLRKQEKLGSRHEPVIAREGDYPDGLVLIRAGFARVSVKLGNGERTLTYLGAGDDYGLFELYTGWQSKKEVPLETTLTALGYVDLLRVPTHILEQHVFPKLKPAPKSRVPTVGPLADDARIEWAVEERLINGTQAMLIDLDRCVRCDDCVRACASTHDGNPRFIRHGRTFDHWMVTNACMHCADPVCMIGCPTGAISREIGSGSVVINDATCIGCATCANSCPYDNIRMVEIRNLDGQPVVDAATQRPILKATKCDLCSSNPGGPACVRACPHDALRRVDFRDLQVGAGD
jgi:Fe-S-cluster-containing dehydrogenase component/CRP-like cAMP-binding protein